MNKKKKTLIIAGTLALLLVIGICVILFGNKENYSGKYVKLVVNNVATLKINLLNNPSAEAFYEKVKEGNIKIKADENGGFEVVGKLDYSLPSNDETFTAKAGDVVLYQGNKIAIFYGNNNYNYTKLGVIESTNASYLKTIFGNGDVYLEFSI